MVLSLLQPDFLVWWLYFYKIPTKPHRLLFSSGEDDEKTITT